MNQIPGASSEAASPPEKPGRAFLRRAVQVGVLLGLYALGCAHWVEFYNRGDLTLAAEDWSKEYGTYWVLRRAIETRQPPYHALNVFHPQQWFHGTNRFLGLPETNLSPQILLLPYLDLGTFFLVNTLLLYSVGFLGCLLIRRRYRLGLVPFTLLFLLFDFNGHIVSHLSVGHSMWNGYFLLPFFCLLLLEWVEVGASPSLSLKLAFVLFAIALQGAFHLAVWCWMFLFFFVAFNPREWRQGLFVFAASGLFCFFRILPAAVTFWGEAPYTFMGGYPTVTDVLEALVVLGDPEHPRVGVEAGAMGWWEFDIYVGVAGFAALVYFGVYLPLSRAPAQVPHRCRALDGPMVVLTLLSLSYLYGCVALLPIPLASAERVPSRFLILPVVFLSILASIRMQRVLEAGKLSAALWVLLVGGLLETAVTLGRHSYAWRISRHEAKAMWPPLPPPDPDVILTWDDPGYVASVQLSALVSCVALGVGLYLLWRWRRPTGQGHPPRLVAPSGSLVGR
jgi:hypothetical protein